MSATGKVGVKRKVTHKTIEFKHQVIVEVEKGGRSQSEVAKQFGISNSTLSTWMTNKESIKKGFVEYGPKRKSMKTGKWDELETALLEWFKNAREQGAIISGNVLLEKADQFAARLSINDFEAKAGWLTRFKDRNGISFKAVCGESKSVDDSVESLLEWQKKLQTLLQRYDPSCIYNADETGIFYKMLPDKTMEFRKVDCHGGKRSKERLTALVCANMTGTDKLPLLIIGKSAKPRCFKNIKTLPAKYLSNKKAWMTSIIFTQWLREIDMKMKMKGRKIVMIVDNCPAHPKVGKLENVELVYLPPNTTSKTQPMDQGVINNLKVHYRKRIVVRQVRCIDKQKDFNVSVLDALRFLRQSWECVTTATIANCFRHAGFTSDTFTSSVISEEEDDELDDIPLAQLSALGNKVLISDFVNFAETVQTSEPVTDDSIISGVIDARASPEVLEDDEEEESVKESDPPTIDQAMDALEILRNFYECSEKSEGELSVLCGLERKILRRKITSLCKRKQTSMMDFVRSGRGNE